MLPAILLKWVENSTQNDQGNKCDEVLCLKFTHEALLVLEASKATPPSPL